MRVDTKRLGGGGKVTLLVGYQHSTSYRLGTRLFQEPVPLGGAFLASMFGPYSLPQPAPMTSISFVTGALSAFAVSGSISHPVAIVDSR